MKTIFRRSVLAVLLAFAPSLCFADWSIGPVSRERAKELGIEIRSKTKGTNEVLVEVEIKIEGELKRFGRERLDHVELQIRDGGKNRVSATLKEDPSREGYAVVRLTADCGDLEKINLLVWVYQGLGGVIHELRLKDFVELAKVR
jgi:hypothetical protein